MTATVAKIHYEADGAIAADRFIAALTDFSERRPELWPDLDAKFYELHDLGDTWADVTEGTDVLGGVWARERYDWSEPGVVRLRLVEAVDFRPGTVTEYRVTPRAGRRLPRRGRLPAHRREPRAAGSSASRVQLTGARRFAARPARDARSPGRDPAVWREPGLAGQRLLLEAVELGLGDRAGVLELLAAWRSRRPARRPPRPSMPASAWVIIWTSWAVILGRAMM